MVFGLFGSKKKKPDTVWRGSPGKRLYAIGDVHGCFDEMINLLVAIEEDHRSRPEKECVIVFLGDLIDRGPHSSRVVEFLIKSPPRFAKVFCLMGNHEEMFLRILRGEAGLIESWMAYGGRECVESYGVDPEQMIALTDDAIQVMIRKRVPQSHIDFLSQCVESIRFGDYLLVHAGVDPERPVLDQDPRQLRWIREPFLSHDKPLGLMVVHGHTVSDVVELMPHRIGVDTGAYRGGKLSAVRIEDDEVQAISVQQTPAAA